MTHAWLCAKYGFSKEVADAEDGDDAREACEDKDEIAGWKELRENVLECLVRDKHQRNAKVKTDLIQTGERELVFWNSNKDRELGIVRDKGENMLGKMLTTVRQDIKDENDFEKWLYLLFPQEDKENWPRICVSEAKEGQIIAPNAHVLQDKPYYIIGKDAPDVKPAHPSISRKHAILYCSRDGVLVFDMASKMGSKLNGNALEAWTPANLGNDGSLALGVSTRTYEIVVDRSLVIAKLKKKQRELMGETNAAEEYVANPLEVARQEIHKKSVVYVGNLPFETTKAHLLTFFSSVIEGEAQIVDVRFPGEKGEKGKGKGKGGKPEGAANAVRGFAFVTFNNPDVAFKALGQNRQEMDGRKITVKAGEDAGNKGKGKGKDSGDAALPPPRDLPPPRNPTSNDSGRRDRSRSPRGRW